MSENGLPFRTVNSIQQNIHGDITIAESVRPRAYTEVGSLAAWCLESKYETCGDNVVRKDRMVGTRDALRAWWGGGYYTQMGHLGKDSHRKIASIEVF